MYETILNFTTQFAGGRGGIDHNVVQFGLAALFWGTALVYARDRWLEDRPVREKLLATGFALGLSREIFMFGMAFILSLGLISHDTLHVIFPPLEHALSNAAIFFVAGAFLYYLIENKQLSRWFLIGSLSCNLICYLATFIWWGVFITENPESKFGQTWCDWIFRINGSFWSALAMMLILACAPKNWSRNWFAGVMFCFFLFDFLKIPDMALNEQYEAHITPFRHAFYLLGVFMLAAIYLREQMLERRALRKEADRLAFYDFVTELPNRHYFMTHFEQTIESSRHHYSRLALMFVDLDHFKSVNDNGGHDVGDALLGHVAELIARALPRDSVFARIGGDEFLILLKNFPDKEFVDHTAETILHCFKHPFEIDERQYRVTASIGIAHYPDNGTDINTLMKNADIALFEAKGVGRNRAENFNDRLKQVSEEKYKISTRLESAIASGELNLHYQVQMDLQAAKIDGVECLLRWENPEFSAFSTEFIVQVAEEFGLIHSLGRFVIAEACRQAGEWKRQGLDVFPMSINVSAKEFNQPEFVELFGYLLEQHSLDPQDFLIEITETAFMTDNDRNLDLLKQLRELGFRLSIDDFGTGYSSLSYLSRLQVDEIKIDRSFIANLGEDRTSMTLVQSILGMAHNLNLQVVAEGVESLEQVIMLRRLGCDKIQGYFFCKPVAAASIPAVLQEAKVALASATDVQAPTPLISI